jgi:hypothetical protein
MAMVQTEVSVLDSPHSYLLGPAGMNNNKSDRDLPLCNHLPIGAITS